LVALKRLVSTAVVVVMLVGGGTAEGAPAAKHLGEVASDATAFGNCPCTSVQFGDIGTANDSYTFPFPGVITRSGFYVGELVNAGDWVQMRSFSRSGTGHAVVTGDGAQHMLQGLPTKSISSFYERLPVGALGALGARYSIGNGSITATPTYLNSPNMVDEVLGTTASLAVGDSFDAAPSKKLRVNVEAVLEPDEDHDGYGDVSQDLCPESPIGGSPCSGSLFGSDLQDAHSGGGGAGFEPLLVQKTVDGASTALPFDGVVVRWRVLSSHSDNFRVRILSPEGGSGLKVLSSSAVESVSVTPSPPIGKVTSFATRLPIPAGSYVGLASPTQALAPIALNVSGASATEYHDAADGSVISAPGTARAWKVAYDADIEPDADHDGYGDISQDSCPSIATVHDGQCPVIDVFPPPATPKITGLEVVPKQFRVKAKGASAKLKLTLSREATVAFGIEAKKTCGGKGKGKKARCKPGFHSVQTITQKLPTGRSVVPYSARLRGQAPLRPGSYRITAVPTAGVTGKAVQATFKVLPPLPPRHRAGH
jgi:hypothetical protein